MDGDGGARYAIDLLSAAWKSYACSGAEQLSNLIISLREVKEKREKRYQRVKGERETKTHSSLAFECRADPHQKRAQNERRTFSPSSLSSFRRRNRHWINMPAQDLIYKAHHAYQWEGRAWNVIRKVERRGEEGKGKREDRTTSMQPVEDHFKRPFATYRHLISKKCLLCAFPAPDATSCHISC